MHHSARLPVAGSTPSWRASVIMSKRDPELGDASGAVVVKVGTVDFPSAAGRSEAGGIHWPGERAEAAPVERRTSFAGDDIRSVEELEGHVWNREPQRLEEFADVGVAVHRPGPRVITDFHVIGEE